jgi:hypothetical protein
MMRLAWDSFRVAVDAPAAPLAWLAEFLRPAFEDAPPGADGARVARVRDPARDAAGAAAGPAGAPRVAWFTRDGDFLTLPCVRGAAGERTMVDTGVRVAQVVRAGGAEVEVVAEADHVKPRTTLMRVVRELATAHALGRGIVPLHASAVASTRGVVAFAGPRRAGKSTLLLHLLLAGGARYVTNDRLLVDARAVVARAMPTIVRLREDALARFPAFASVLRAYGFDRAHALAEAAPPSRRWPPSLSPAQLCAAAGARAGAVGAGPLARIVFPEIDPAPGFDLSPLEPGAAAERLARGLLLPGGEARAAEAFAGPSAEPGRAMVPACAAVAACAPCYTLRLGPDAYAAPDLAPALLE